MMSFREIMEFIVIGWCGIFVAVIILLPIGCIALLALWLSGGK